HVARGAGGSHHWRFQQCGRAQSRQTPADGRGAASSMSNRISTNVPLDQQDVRLKREQGLAGTIRAFWVRVRTGDLGSLPVVVGLVIICSIFQYLNPVFLSSNNLVNLLFDCSTVGIIALGVVCVLMVGEIDLSVGSVSGLASTITGVLWVSNGWPVAAAILAAL